MGLWFSFVYCTNQKNVCLELPDYNYTVRYKCAQRFVYTKTAPEPFEIKKNISVIS